jgi:hypothetical protein
MLANSLARPDLEKPPFTRYTVPGIGKVRESLVDSQENYFSQVNISSNISIYQADITGCDLYY